LLVIRSLMGMLTAPIYPACSRVVAQWVPITQRARANGLIQGAAAVGIACTFPVFGAMIDWFDWPIAFVISGTGTGVLAVVWTVYASNSPADHRGASTVEKRPIQTGEPDGAPPSIALPPPWWHLLRHRSLLLLTLSYAAVGYIEYLFFFWMHYYFEDVLKFEKSDSRIYAAILTLAMAVGMVLGGWIADRLRARLGGHGSVALVPAIGLCAGGGLLILGVLAQETVWIVTLLALALAAVGATEAPVWTMAVELGKRHGGTAAAICNTGGNAGGMLAPIVTPFVSGWLVREFALSERLGWQWSISLGSAIAVFGALL
jgi:sugar phosphate permease